MDREDGAHSGTFMRFLWEQSTAVCESVLCKTERAVHISGAINTQAEDFLK